MSLLTLRSSSSVQGKAQASLVSALVSVVGSLPCTRHHPQRTSAKERCKYSLFLRNNQIQVLISAPIYLGRWGHWGEMLKQNV